MIDDSFHAKTRRDDAKSAACVRDKVANEGREMRFLPLGRVESKSEEMRARPAVRPFTAEVVSTVQSMMPYPAGYSIIPNVVLDQSLAAHLAILSAPASSIFVRQ